MWGDRTGAMVRRQKFSIREHLSDSRHFQGYSVARVPVPKERNWVTGGGERLRHRRCDVTGSWLPYKWRVSLATRDW